MKHKRSFLRPADPAWPSGTALRVVGGMFRNAPRYVWHEKQQDMILCGFVPEGTEVIYVQAWEVRGLRFAECSHGYASAPIILIESNVKPAH